MRTWDGETQLKSSLDFLKFYLGIDEKQCLEYIRQGKANQLLRISSKLYHRHYRKKVEAAYER
jgi:hypothetical protein